MRNVLAAVIFATVACGSLPGDSATDAELHYRTLLLRCVDRASTLAESKACRKAVDAEVFR